MTSVKCTGRDPSRVDGDAAGATGEGLPLLEVRGLRKEYPGVVALDGIDLAIWPGEVVGLVGKNGAGKSTLIKLLAAAESPNKGEILLDGARVQLHNPHQANLLGLSFVHQELADAPNLSVAENVELGLGYPRRLGVFVDWAGLRRKTETALARLQLEIDPAVRVARLSVAQQRLVTIARGLAMRMRLLVLDEPTAALTEEEVGHLHAVVRSLAEEGVAVLYVSHRLDEIFEITDRVVVMRDGRVVADLPTAGLDRATLVGHITGAEQTESAGRRRICGATSKRELLRVEGISLPGVVEDVSLRLLAGEVLGIAGLVGAGRTELVRLIFGADRRAAGRIFVGGRELRIKNPRQALDAGLVLLPEDRRTQGTILNFSIRKNVTLAVLPKFRLARPLPVPVRSREAASARRLIDRLEIAARDEEQLVEKLSGGTQQKVVLAKWLERGADVFIFDEPTHGIDVEAKAEFYALMQELADEGKGVIFVSSEFSELVLVSHRVVVMHERRLVGELVGDEINERSIVERCYAARLPPAA
jgi:ABC-type sugar transport system ATPase subunit